MSDIVKKLLLFDSLSQVKWTVILLIILYFPVYYGGIGIYPWFDRCYEQHKWTSCGDANETWCERVSEEEGLVLLIRIPQYVSDFLEETVEVTVKNVGKQSLEGTRVTLELEPSTEQKLPPVLYVYTGEGKEREQGNVLVFPEIPLGGRVTKTYKIRVSMGQPGKIETRFRLNGKQLFYPPFRIETEFNRLYSLIFWIASTFLLPPGSNWLIVLVSIQLGKGVAKWRERKRGSKHESQGTLQITGKPATMMLTVDNLTDVLTGGVPSDIAGKPTTVRLALEMEGELTVAGGARQETPKSALTSTMKQGDSANQSPGGGTGEETHQLIKDETQENQADSQGTGANQQSAETPPSSAPSVPDES